MHTPYSKCVLPLWLIFLCWTPLRGQSSGNDSVPSPYRVNFWISGSLLAAGATANYLGSTQMLEKAQITRAEMQALDKDVINSIDRWAFRQDAAMIDANGRYSDIVLGTGVVLPFALLLDSPLRRDWVELLVMYLETMSLVPNLYEWSFFGPYFQNRIRPVTYYEELSYEQRNSGNNRNSFYSGHVATVAAATFFMVKVYSDYHPGVGNDKYLLYTAALLPPVLLGYFRVRGLRHFPSDVAVGIGIGAVCGILVPELHRLSENGVTLGVYSTQESTGVAFSWHPR